MRRKKSGEDGHRRGGQEKKGDQEEGGGGEVEAVRATPAGRACSGDREGGENLGGRRLCELVEDVRHKKGACQKARRPTRTYIRSSWAWLFGN